MKRLYFLFSIALALCWVTIGCEKQENPVSLGDNSKSEIELMEKQSGQIFYKRDLVLKDASGQNEVTLRLAALSKDKLDLYLQRYEYSISPNLTARKTSISKGEILSQSSSIEKKEPELIVEALSVKLQTGASGYSLNVRMKPKVYKSLANARAPSDYTTQIEFVSGNWPTWCNLMVEARTYGEVNQVELLLKQKNRWYEQFSTRSSGTYNSGGGNAYYSINIDGPYRVSATVYHTPFFRFVENSTVPGFTISLN